MKAVHPLGAEELVPVGYVSCGCGEFLVRGSREANNGCCDSCQVERDAEVETNVLRFEVQGRTFEHRRPHPQKRGPQPKPVVRPPRTDRDRARTRAKRKALMQLAKIYAPQYELLYAAARAAEGLDPRVRVEAPRAVALRDALLADIAEAEAREARRVEAGLLRTT